MSLLPNLIIGGLHKSGTSSLYSYLTQHPDICGASKKEPYYFWPLVYNRKLAPLEEYKALFTDCSSSRYRFEATARYFYGGSRVAKGIKNTLGEDTKIIFIFREQLSQLFSIFKYKKYNLIIPKDEEMHDYVQKSLHEGSKEIFEDETGKFNVLEHGKYHYYLSQWFDIFGSNVKVTFLDDLKSDPLSYLKDLAEWLDIDAAAFESINLDPDNQAVNVKSTFMHNYARKTFHGFETFWRNNPKVKNFARDLYHKLNGTKHSDIMDGRTRDLLSEHYKKENQNLLALLREHGYNKFPSWLESNQK